MNRTPPPAPRRDIQGLRALAVLAVVGAHAVGWPRGGFVGVDVFFVISGFLITGLLLREVEATGRVSLARFYGRRARRLVPAAVVVLTLTVGAGFVVFNAVVAERTLHDAVWSALFAANWHFAAEGTDYFHATDAASALQHFWSLSVEEQFYLVWPGVVVLSLLLLPAAARRGRRGRLTVAGIAAAVVLASALWAASQTASEATVAYFSTLTRAWELGAGAVLAAAAPLLARIPRPVGGTMAWVGLAGIVTAFAVIDPAVGGFPAPWAALPVAATALVLAGGVGGDPRHRHLFPLTNPLSVFVGDMSYSLYLWHFPVIVLASVVLAGRDQALWLTLGAIAVLSLATYLIVEQPLRYAPLVSRWADAIETASSTPMASPSTAVVPAAPAQPRVVATRPAGWTPGTRYYPGSPRPRPLTADRVIEPVLADPDPEPVVVPIVAPQEPSAEQENAGGSAWKAWRARFGTQMALASSGLGIAVLTAVLVAQSIFGAPVIGPLSPPAEAQAGGGDDPIVAIQSELAAAASATQWPSLSPSLDTVIARGSADNPARDCFAPDVTPDAGRCSWGAEQAATRIYLVGDSTAMAYAPAFKKMAEDSGGTIRVTTVGLYGCRFTEVAVQNDGAGVMAACEQRKADVRAMVLADAPSMVVMSDAYTLGHTPDGQDLSAETLIASQRAEAAGYGAPGRIVHLAPPPEGADLARCYSPLTSPYDCASAVSPTWQQMEALAERAAAASGDHAISSLPFSCWEGVCPAFAGTLPVKYDQTHLSVPFAEHIAPILRAELAGAGLL
ncbi:acyltransferase family protein [Microbacterium sp. BG28]|uniref:acyltransferase family protein n=1 Tax=Microbacterium sp. BG28 TaxID=3097356 RepID=UPI002A59E676|nr:acyltransferase family protein [Microbacterium sp. BG28]MDY0828183.1 acyltransferase family protein [Microbacterium sp. BG28]